MARYRSDVDESDTILIESCGSLLMALATMGISIQIDTHDRYHTKLGVGDRQRDFLFIFDGVE